MAQDEAVLLQRFAASGDAGAFSEIVHRYASLVYSACMRILADKDTAADATQETFFQLSRNAGAITGSVPAWLHRVATSKAVDRIRSESSRRRAESRYADAKCRQVEKWEDLSPYVDQALDDLDAPSRELLIEYFFEGRSLADIGADKGLSHPTVSRHVKAAVDKLRGRLLKSGVAVSVIALEPLLTENGVQAAPAAVLNELAKIALAGAEVSGSAAVGGLLIATKAKIIIVAAAVGIGAVGVLTHRYFSRSSGSGDAAPIAQGTAGRPNPVSPASDGSQEPVAPAVDGTPAEAKSADSRPGEAVADADMPGPEQQPPDTTEQTQDDQTSELDLSTPEASITTFLKAFVAGDVESILACCVPDGSIRGEIQNVLYGNPDPDDPQQREIYEAQQWLESLDPEAEMPIVSTQETSRGTSVTWLVTFRRDFATPGRTFAPGDQMEVDANLVQRDGKWLIESIL